MDMCGVGERMTTSGNTLSMDRRLVGVHIYQGLGHGTEP